MNKAGYKRKIYTWNKYEKMPIMQLLNQLNSYFVNKAWSREYESCTNIYLWMKKMYEIKIRMKEKQ